MTFKEYIRFQIEKTGVFFKEIIETPSLTASIFERSEFYESSLDVFEDLNGKKERLSYKQREYTLETEDFLLILDDELYYNRYKSVTFRAELYDKLGYNLPLMRTKCRNLEKECLKKGSVKHIWTNPDAELIFGRSEEPGDFGLNGSAGWKLLAWQDYLADLNAFERKKKLIRISSFDELLIEGKLTPLKTLLLYRNEKNEAVLQNYLCRILGIKPKEKPVDYISDDNRELPLEE